MDWGDIVELCLENPCGFLSSKHKPQSAPLFVPRNLPRITRRRKQLVNELSPLAKLPALVWVIFHLKLALLDYLKLFVFGKFDIPLHFRVYSY